MKDLKDNVSVVAGHLLKSGEDESIGTNKAGIQYLHQKQLLQMGAALNLCTYLLFKAENANKKAVVDGMDDMRNHPVIDRLNAFSELADKFETGVEEPLKLQDQLRSLAKAVTLMKNDGDVVTASDSSSSDDSDDSSSEDEDSAVVPTTTIDEDEESFSREEDEEEQQHDLLTDARFGVRAQDLALSTTAPRRKPRDSDVGDDDDGHNDTRRKEAANRLASTMNTLAQKEKTSRKAQTSSDILDDLPERPIGTGVPRREEGEDLAEYERGIKMMEDMMGPGSEEDEGDGEDDGMLDSEEEEDGLYDKVARSAADKKQERKAKYAVAPKYPRLEGVVAGERAVGDMILKNRGLVPHKNKLNRNPRVKKREQYRKALIKRRGAVREVRTGETDVYGGEGTGIKSGLSRSRKLGVNK